MSAVALLFFHIWPSPTLSTFLCCIYAVSSHRCCPSCLFASLRYKLSFLPFSLSLSLSHTHTHTHTPTHTFTHTHTHTLSLIFAPISGFLSELHVLSASGFV